MGHWVDLLNRQWMVWFAIVVHLTWGVVLLTMPLGEKDSSGGVLWNIYVQFLGQKFWGCWFIGASILAIWAMVRKRNSLRTLIALLPQQAALTVGALGIFTPLIGFGHPFELSRIIRVAPIALAAFLFHTLAILDIHIWKHMQYRSQR